MTEKTGRFYINKLEESAISKNVEDNIKSVFQNKQGLPNETVD